MATKINMLMTPEFRVSFPTLFNPESFQGGKLKYSVIMVFPKSTDLTQLKEAARAAVETKWPDKATRPAPLKNPFRDGSEKELDGFGPDTVFITASSMRKPGVVGRDPKNHLTESELYAGCYCRATVNAFAYDKAGNRGVSFGLQNIQFLRAGDPLAGGAPPEQDFDMVEGGDDDFFGDGQGTAPSIDEMFT